MTTLPTPRALLRASLWLLGALLLTACVYRAHALRGEVAEWTFPPQRVVSMTLAGDEILLALLPPERILGLSHLIDDPRYSHAVASAARVRHRVRADAEQVLTLQPDLVVLSASVFTGVTARALLEQTGVPLCELPWHDSLAGVQQNILAVGRAVGALPQARRLVAAMDRRLRAVQERVAGASWPRTLYYFPGGFTAGRGTTLHEMIERAGGRNVAPEAGIRGVKQIAREVLVGLDPEVILVGGASAEESLRPVLLADPSLATVDAIRRDRVEVVTGPAVGSLSHHVVNGVEIMARLLHPAAFPDASEPVGLHARGS